MHDGHENSQAQGGTPDLRCRGTGRRTLPQPPLSCPQPELRTDHRTRLRYEDALALAREIANKNPDAIRGNKRIFNSVGQMSEADALQQESNIQDAIIGSPNQIEAVKSSLQKRAPDFVDP